MNLKFAIKFSSKYNELVNTRGRISLVVQNETMRFSLFLNGLNQRSWLPHLYGYPAIVNYAEGGEVLHAQQHIVGD
jgi:hypothetical protein